MNRQLLKELNEMVKIDQDMRKKAAKDGKFNISVDRANTRKLKKIIAEHGWPTISKVGKKGSFNAWLIAQHADHDRAFQSKVLTILKKIYKKDKKDINISNIAFLEDRILMGRKKKQIFGTQFYFNEKGNFVPWPIKKNNNLDSLREKYGLPSIKEYIKSAKGVRKP